MVEMTNYGFQGFYETVTNDAFVISCHSRESGNPGTCKYLK